MKLAELSDMHLEFGQYTNPLPDADILLISGDLAVADSLQPNKTDQRSRQHQKTVTEFFDKCKKYKFVFCIAGNHEHYHGIFDNTNYIMKDFVQKWPNIVVLDNDFIVIDDYLIAGTTMWTDMDKENPISMFQIQQGINDYRTIRRLPLNHYDVYHPLITPKEILGEHKINKNWLNEVIDNNQDKKIIVMTHHAPSHLSISQYYVNNKLNGSFVSDLTDLMKEHVYFWFHGHMHESFDYMINKTRVICNPRGYTPHDLNPKFNPNLVMEI